MKITTGLGTTYIYNKWTNKILEESNVEEDTDNRIVQFNPVNKITCLSNVDTFVVEITQRCNFRCSYCCYSGKYRNNRIHSNFSMNEMTIDACISFIVEKSLAEIVNVAFYGGEALLEFGRVKLFVDRAHTSQKKFHFLLSTNGYYLTENIVDWLVKNDFDINLSLDGGLKYHNLNRIQITGGDSFDVVHTNVCYIKNNYVTFFDKNVHFLMTVANLEDLIPIAEEWNSFTALRDKAPSHVSSVAPNYAVGVKIADEFQAKRIFYKILNYYEEHKYLLVLYTFLFERISDLLERPIFDLIEFNRISTCLPTNKKLFVDANGKIGVCEKMSDIYRVGDVFNGFDWGKINEQVRKLVKRKLRYCSSCPFIRLCDVCLTSNDLSEKEFDIFCHNQKCYITTLLTIFCEMAERGLIDES
jgi:uncharacterized protein